MFSSMSHQFALSSPRSLVRRRVEHEKKKKILNLQATMYYFQSLLSKHIRSLPVSKVEFINK